jgi:hypothetical protein
MPARYVIEVRTLDGSFTFTPAEGDPFDPLGSAMDAAERLAEEGVWNMETTTFYPAHSIRALAVRETHQN